MADCIFEKASADIILVRYIQRLICPTCIVHYLVHEYIESDKFLIAGMWETYEVVCMYAGVYG